MTGAYQPEEIPIDNERSLKKLIRSIANSQGNFVLIIARCNYRSLQDQIVQQLKQECPVEIRELHLSKSIKTLFTTIQADLGGELPQALMIFGLEFVEVIDQILISTNQVREEFRKNFSFPIVLWVNDEIFKKLIRLMPDFKNWTGNSIKFEIASQELIENLSQVTISVFNAILEVGAGRFLDNASLNLAQDAHYFLEMESAVENLLNSLQSLEPELKASLQFILGREADASGKKAEARDYYEQSLSYWQQQVTNQVRNKGNIKFLDVKRYGCVVWHLGLWWRQYATMHRSEYREACQKAKLYFQKCVEVFEQNNFPDLAAKYINAWGEVLTRLEVWDELEKVAFAAINLNKTHLEQTRLAYSYGLMAEVALKKSEWEKAKEYAELALHTNDIIKHENIPPIRADIRDWEQKHYRNLYLLLLAEAQQHLNQVTEAITHLETARSHSNPQSDPLLYIRILSNLRKFYFDQGKYLEAFNIKQEQRSIEQQYGLRAFVGAGRLQSRRQVINPKLAGVADSKTAITQEIAASGRLQDVNRLIERIGRPDHKLTVIYGQSGVGKSSLVQAGLLPALKQRSVEARDVVPVLLQVYTDLAKALGSSFVESIEEVRGLSFPLFLDTMAAFTQELRKNVDSNFLTVLIFDQFEEFFFAYKDPTQRLPFFEFIRDCLNIPYVKIILSLREDYLHYLLECNRLAKLDAIDSNILDKKILYYLGNFSPEDARSVIESLTETSQFYLEPPLIDELVRDLASNLNEVRPIELQVVGAQLQTEKITTLAQYQERGPKEELVGHFLEEVVKDCGQNNEQFTKLVLYILTDENNTRPLKTRAELEADLALEPERLDLILKILVKSGLVFQVPGFPADRYQLVHDYLVPFVRQQQSERLIKELEKEKEQRKLTEEKLNKVLRQQLRAARKASFTLVGLVIAIGGIAVTATVAGINLYLNRPIVSSEQNSQLEYLVAGIKQGKSLKKMSFATIPGTHLNVLAQLNEAIYNTKELNHLRGHKGTVRSISFSNDDKLLATVSDDKTIKIWSIDGKNIQTLSGHQGTITSVSFSGSGQLIATASNDKTVKIWSLKDGKVIKELRDPLSNFTSVSFSPDSKILAVSDGKNVKLWNLANGKTQTLSEHQEIITSVSFSPNGKIIVSADNDDAVVIWKLDGTKLRKIDNYGAMSMSFSKDGKNLVVSNKDKTIKIYELETGILVKNFSIDNEIAVTNLSPDSKHFVFTGRYQSNVIYIRKTDEYSNLFSLGYHNKQITSLRFSHNGKLLASASEDKTIKVWSIENKAFKQPEAQDSAIYQVQFSPNSKMIATQNSGQVQLWSQNGSLLSTYEGYSSLNFSPDSKIFATLITNNVVQLSTIDGQDVFLRGQNGIISSINFSPDGKTIATTQGKTVKLWNRSNGSLLKTFTNHKKSVNSLTFSYDGKILASIGDDNQVSLYTSNGSFIKTLPGHTESVSNVTFSNDSQIIASQGDNNLVKLWKPDGTFIKALAGHRSQVKEVLFSEDDKIIASRGDSDGVKLWQRNGRLISTIDYPGVKNIAFSPDSSIIASSYDDNTVKIWSVEGRLITTFRKHNDTVNTINFSPDGRTIASAGNDRKVQLWYTNGTLIKTLYGHTSGVNTVKFSPDGKYLVSVGEDNKVILWNREGKLIQTLNDGNQDVLNNYYLNNNLISFSPNSKIITFLISTQNYNENFSNFTAKIWDTEGKKLKNLRNSSLIDLDKVSISSDGKTLAFPLPVYDWQLRKVDDGKIFATLKNFDFWSNTLSFSPDSKTIATLDKKNTIQLWSKDNTNNLDKPYVQLKGHSAKINSLSFSPDSNIIASASDDKTVILWNRDGTRLKTLQHEAKVKSVVFNPSDGKTIASAFDDSNVQLWSRDGKLLHTLPHNSSVKDIAFSPDGNIILTASDDTVKLWNRDGTPIKTIEGISGNSSSYDFSPDSRILAAVVGLDLKLHSPNSVWVKDDPLIRSFSEGLNGLSFKSDGKTIAIASGEGVSTMSLDLDELLRRSCSLAHNYLKNNPRVESDRALCDDISQ